MKYESLIGEFGTIVPVNDGIYKVEITNDKIARLYGDGQYSFTIPDNELITWMRYLRVHSTGNGGVRFSDWFEED